MGANLVTQVLAHWTHVSDRAFRVLVRMAVTALDKPDKGRPAGVYHAGRELLAMSLRSEKGTPETQYRAVKRALAELAKEGAIQHLKIGWSGQNSVYRLTLDRARMGGSTDPPVGGSTDPPKGGSYDVGMGGSTDPPKEPRGGSSSGATEEEVVDLRTGSHSPRVTGANVIQLFPDAEKPDSLQARLDAIIARTETS